MLIYPFGKLSGGAKSTRLAQLLEQEGQPCSYCIAVFLMIENNEKLSELDRWAYSNHLAREHKMQPYLVQP
jgi:hypothetical protein